MGLQGPLLNPFLQIVSGGSSSPFLVLYVEKLRLKKERIFFSSISPSS